MRRTLFAISILMGLLLSACGGGQAQLSDEDAVNTIVAATLQANGTAMASEAQPAGEEAEEEAPSKGSISGTLSYPSEGIPPLTVVAYQEGSDFWFAVKTELNQGDYQIDGLDAGFYTVVAYPTDANFGGGFSQAVPCGLSVDCTDHTLIRVEVKAGEITSDVDPQDWYAEEGAFPNNPMASAEEDEEERFGSIAGSLSFPSSFIPAMQVTAFNIETGFWWYVLTVQNQGSYQLDDLPTGKYLVVAYPVGDLEGGGYTAAVPCGLSVDCTDHALLSVEVKADEVTEGVDPGDWYAGPGAFPQNPAP